jgi:hypothetical protein
VATNYELKAGMVVRITFGEKAKVTDVKRFQALYNRYAIEFHPFQLVVFQDMMKQIPETAKSIVFTVRGPNSVRALLEELGDKITWR